jgi:hypothetical protein
MFSDPTQPYLMLQEGVRRQFSHHSPHRHSLTVYAIEILLSQGLQLAGHQYNYDFKLFDSSWWW